MDEMIDEDKNTLVVLYKARIAHLLVSRMFSGKLCLVVCVVLLFAYSKSNESEEDYPEDEDNNEFEDCEYEVDFKTYKQKQKVDLCEALKNPPPKSRIRLQIYANHTDEKLHLRASTLSSKSGSTNESLLSLTTDIIDDFKNPTSLLTIDDSQLISLSTLQSILSSLINVNLKLLSKNLKKTLIVVKGGHKQILSCSGTLYPKQDLKALNIKASFPKAITCNKEPQQDRFFTLQEKTYLNSVNQKTFNLVDIHQDNQKKIVRSAWYTCNNPAACKIGLQDKKLLDKTVNYVLKVLQKSRTAKKTPSG